MKRQAILLLLGILFLNPGTATRAAAEPLQIRSGFVFVNENPVSSFGLDFGLFGDGFSFLSEDFSFEHFAAFSPSDPPFRLRFSGVEAVGDNTSCSGCTYDGDFLFQYAPTVVGQSVPFSMTGVLAGFRSGSSDAVIQAQLMGSGRMSPAEQRVLFLFADQSAPAPVPEPGTMLLVGAGAAALVRRRLCSARL